MRKGSYELDLPVLSGLNEWDAQRLLLLGYAGQHAPIPEMESPTITTTSGKGMAEGVHLWSQSALTGGISFLS